MPGWRDWLFSAKTFAAAMLAFGIALAADLDRPYWTIATVYATSQPLSGATRSKAAFRVAGTLLGAAAVLVLVPNLNGSPELLVLAMMLWTAGCLGVALLDRTPRSYVFMLAAYTAPIIGFPSVAAPEAVWDTAVSRSEEIILGIVCASLVANLVSKTLHLTEAGRRTYRQVAADHEHVAAGLLEKVAPADMSACLAVFARIEAALAQQAAEA